MKKFVFGLFLAIFSLTAFAQYDPKALETLDAMSKRYKEINAFEASISSVMTNEVEKLREEMKARITVNGEKFRLVLLSFDPEKKTEVTDQEVINNGTTVWTYVASAREVTIDDVDPTSDEINPAKIHEIYKKGYKYLYLGEQTEAGVPVEVVDLVPEKRNAQYFKIRMNISKKDRTIKSWVMFDKSGSRYTYTVTKFTPGAKVDDAFFVFDPKKYPGVAVEDLR